MYLMKTIVLKITVAVLCFVLLFSFFQRLIMPKYATIAIEGNLIREYYDSNKDHDVIFIGDCEVYANFSPITLWEDYGITSFIRGSPQQLLWHSYYLLEDTFNRAQVLPEVVVFNVFAMQYGEPQYEPYNRLTLDGMRMSRTKLRAVSASMMEEEDLLSYIFPFFRFKDNWRELGAEDFRYFFGNPQVSINGFMVRSDVMPVGFLPGPLYRANFDFDEKPLYYLNRIVELTSENNVELILVKAPNPFPHWFDAWDEQVVQFAEENDLIYINFLRYTDLIGLDWYEHTFNAGGHLNVFGAELLARYFGEFLVSEFNLRDRRTEPDIAAHWNEMAEQYHRLIEMQLEEIDRYGYIVSLKASLAR